MTISGLTVGKVLITPAEDIDTEAYVGVLIDRKAQTATFIVSAEGGGLYAAYFTAIALSVLQDADPAFARHVFAISGVVTCTPRSGASRQPDPSTAHAAPTSLDLPPPNSCTGRRR